MHCIRFLYRDMLVVPLLFCSLYASSQDIFFNRVPAPEQQPWPWLTGITQDTRGYMWFAGADGLYRHDGIRTTIFRHNPSDTNSISNKFLFCIYADKAGIIWTGSLGGGLDRFDPVQGIFTHYRHNEKDPGSISSDTVMAIGEDRDGFLWIGSSNGLNRLDKTTGKFTRYQHHEDDPESLSFDMVLSIYEDKKGILWVGTGDPYGLKNINSKEGGLNRMDKKTGRFKRFLHDPKDESSLIENRVGAIFEDSHGTFWVGTAGDGLHTLDRNSDKFIRYPYDPSHPDKLSRPQVFKLLINFDDYITFITEDKSGAIWIGTLMQGLVRYDPQTKKAMRYYTAGNADGNFSDQSGWAAYTSKDGVLWISTWQRTIYRIDPQQTKLSLPDFWHLAQAIAKDDNGFVWIPSDSNLVKMNANKNIVKIYKHNFSSLAQRTMLVSKNKIWIGTALGGLYSFDTQTENFEIFGHNDKDSASLINNDVLSLAKAKDGKLWVGTAQGLNQFDPETGRFIHFRPGTTDSNSAPTANLHILMEDTNGILWIGTNFGVKRFDPKTIKFRTWLEGISITGLLRDSDGILWAGTQSGLYKFDKHTETFIQFTDPQTGKSIVKILFIIEDNQKNLWILAQSSLLRINAKRNSLNVYGKSYGVTQNTKALYLNAVKNNDGEIFFSDDNGNLYSFFPDKLKGNDSPPLIDFAALNFSGQSGSGSQTAPINISLSDDQSLKLSYDQNVFSIDYAVMHYSSPADNQHFYMLQNYDNNWRQGDADQRAYYFKLSPGRYTFKVKAASYNGVWSEKSMTIIVNPPWWRTWWAYTIYGLLLAFSIYRVHLFQKNRLLKREQEKTRAIELSHAKEIEKAYTELQVTQSQLIHSEKMASLGELTAGIAHEIQNPLNFVNNFSEVNSELITEMKDELTNGNIEEAKRIADAINDNEQKIIFHGKRADTIVKGMLQHSRSSSGLKEPTDINALADEYLRLAYHGLRAKDKSFNATMKTNFDESIGKINIIPQDIGRVILNLITNAFYAAPLPPEGGFKDPDYKHDPTVWVSTKKVGDKVLISVRDNGPGIPQKIVDKIFHPFFTTKPTGQGTGLGLSLSYDIVKAHGGEIKVETKEGEGSEFVITLPY